MNGARKTGQPKKGYPMAKKGPAPDISMGGPRFPVQIGKTQPKDRSMGMRPVKVYPQKKGL